MASVKSHGRLTVGTVTIRRKPALTYQSPTQNAAILQSEEALFTSQSVTAPPLPPSPPTQPCQLPVPSQGSAVTHKASRHRTITPPLPLYHPFGPLALSLPDLDPTVFGLPAPVAVFDDPTRRSSSRQRRPTAKVRDVDEPATSHPPSLVGMMSILETEVREESSPRRRRGGGPGGKRRRKEPEDGDATYPAKRLRNPRSSGVGLGMQSARARSREEGSPTLSNTHSRASPALEAGRSDLAEEKKPERRTTRSHRVVARRDSTASEDTVTSGSPSVSATNTAVARVASSGEPMEMDGPAAKQGSSEAAAPGAECKEAESNDAPVPEQREVSGTSACLSFASGSM